MNRCGRVSGPGFHVGARGPVLHWVCVSSCKGYSQHRGLFPLLTKKGICCC